MYKYYICDVPEMGEILDEINNGKEDLISSFYISDSQQVCIITSGAKDVMKEKIRNLMNPTEI